MPARRPEMRVIVDFAPDVQRQVRALLLLLGQPSPETRQPQEVSPEASIVAAVASGSYTWSEHHDDSTVSPDSQ